MGAKNTKTTGLNRNSPQPLSGQLEGLLRQCIHSGRWAVNTPIPSENELARHYGLSRMTVRGVVNRLAADGLVYRVQGKGTFVAQPKIIGRPLSQMGIHQQLELMGYESTTKLLQLAVIEPPLWVSSALQLEAGAPVYIVRRMRSLQGQPFSIHTSYIPKATCPGLEEQDLENMQLCVIQEEVYHNEIVKRVETLESVVASPEEAALLEVKKNAPILLFENLVYTVGDCPIEYARVIFRGDKIKIRLQHDKIKGV